MEVLERIHRIALGGDDRQLQVPDSIILSADRKTLTRSNTGAESARDKQ